MVVVVSGLERVDCAGCWHTPLFACALLQHLHLPTFVPCLTTAILYLIVLFGRFFVTLPFSTTVVIQVPQSSFPASPKPFPSLAEPPRLRRQRGVDQHRSKGLIDQLSPSSDQGDRRYVSRPQSIQARQPKTSSSSSPLLSSCIRPLSKPAMPTKTQMLYES